MKQLINKLFNTKVSTSYMFILFGLSALMLAGYFSYAWFTVQGVQQYSVVTGTLNGTVAIGSNSVTINGSGVITYTPSTDNDSITLTVTNTNDRTVKNSIYYYTLSDSSIEIGYTSDSPTIPTVEGVSVEQGKTLTYKIKINGSKGKVIKIGSSMGLSSSNLTLPSGTIAFEPFSLSLSQFLLTNIGSSGNIDISDSEQTFITGTNPNNYIWYSGKLWRAVSIDSTDNSVKLVTQWNMTSLDYSIGADVYANSAVNQWLNDTSIDGFLGNLREPNKFLKSDSVWNATKTSVTTKPLQTTMITNTVGLLNIYEYTMGCKNVTNKTCYLNNGLYWWTITPYNSNSAAEFYYISYDGSSSSIYTTREFGLRPSVNLKSTVKIVDGNGTSDNPYKLEGDNDKPVSSYLSTRYSGEYIRFGTGENNLYRIVSHENGLGTKITSAFPLKENGNYMKIEFGTDSSFSSNYSIGNFLNNDYLEESKYLTSKEINMIDDNTKWYLGTVGTYGNYKLSKYQDTSSTNLSTKTAIAKIGLLRYGELMSGIFSSSNESTVQWTLTPYEYSRIRTIYLASGSNNSSTDSYALSPTMNLKSNVIITDGKGTKKEPFIIELK